jgi:UTP--glucose-1-phosphate uridylyltransferase
MIMQSQTGCLSQMFETYRQTGGNVIAIEECDPQETQKYGIVGRGESVVDKSGGAFKITEMVEKPLPDAAPSNLYISGRYILQPEIFALLGRHQRGAGNEIQLTDAMIALSEAQPFYAHRFDGRTFDCGSKIGFLVANVAFALDRSELSDGLVTEIHALLAKRTR